MAVYYETGVFNYAYSHTEGAAPDLFRIYWGTSPGNRPNPYSFPATAYSGTVPISSVLPGVGTYYAIIYAVAGTREYGNATEIAFDVILTPPALVDPTCTIQVPATDPYNTDVSTVVLSGVATPSNQPGSVILNVQWYNDQTAQGGVCTGTTAWTSSAIALASGTNHISVWATTNDAPPHNIGGDAISVVYTPIPPPVSGPGLAKCILFVT